MEKLGWRSEPKSNPTLILTDAFADGGIIAGDRQIITFNGDSAQWVATDAAPAAYMPKADTLGIEMLVLKMLDRFNCFARFVESGDLDVDFKPEDEQQVSDHVLYTGGYCYTWGGIHTSPPIGPPT